MIYSTPAQLALSTIPTSLIEGQESEDGQYAEFAANYVKSQIAAFERLWKLSDAELVAELADIRKNQSYAADERDWDEYEGWEVARYEVYAVQTNREAIADEAEQAKLISEPSAPLTYRPFAALAG